MTYFYKTMLSPLGELKLIASPKGLAAVLWPDDKQGDVRLAPQVRDDQNEVLIAAEVQLQDYFAGRRSTFDIELDARGTEFQRSVWAELLKIPFGQTRSYGEIAERIGNPKAVRAVGAANGRNPLSIIAPCNRVIGANGTPTGFAGGLAAKAYLLQLEREFVAPRT